MNLDTNGAKETLVSIKRDGAGDLDDLFGYSAKDVENESGIEVIGNNLNEIIVDYRRYIGVGDCPDQMCTNLVLLPQEINSAIQLIYISPESKLYPYSTGTYLTALINNSYDAGHNNFNLSLNQDLIINDLGEGFVAEKKRPLKLNLIGDVGYALFTNAHFVDACIIGDVGKDALNYSHNCSIFIKGNVAESLGSYSNNCSFNIKGDVGNSFGYESSHLSCKILGDVSFFFGNSSIGLNAIIKGNVDSNFGYVSKRLNAMIDGDVGCEFGLYSNSFKAIVDGNVKSVAERIPSGEIFISGNVETDWDENNWHKGVYPSYPLKSHEIYKSKMQELEVLEKW